MFGNILPSLSIESFDKSFNSNSYLYEVEDEILDEGVSTVFVINEKHYLTISYSYKGATINENNQGFIVLYN